MSMSIKSVLLGLGLVGGIALGAQAQTALTNAIPGTSIANLPSEGPRASSLEAIPTGQHLPLAASGNYPGPAPGAGTGQMPPRYQKPADWEANTGLHPYTSGIGPRPN